MRFVVRDDGAIPQSSPAAGSDAHQVRRRKQIEPETYDGKTNLDDYLEDFEEISRWNGWTSYEQALQLAMKLTGSAKKVYKGLSTTQKNSYAEMVTCLKKTFDEQNQPLVYQERFWKRKKQPNEELLDYVGELKDFAARAFGDMVDDRNAAYKKMLVNKFVAGLDDRDAGKWVHMKNASDLEEAVAIVREIESYKAITPNTKLTSQINAVHPAIENGDVLCLLRQVSDQQKELLEDVKSIKRQLQINTSDIAENKKMLCKLGERVTTIESHISSGYDESKGQNYVHQCQNSGSRSRSHSQGSGGHHSQRWNDDSWRKSDPHVNDEDEQYSGEEHGHLNCQ